MRILLLLFIPIQFAFSQGDPLFKIISCSEGTLLDGIQIKPGQLVYASSMELAIPKNGYVGVITIDGYAHSFDKDVKTSLINKRVRKIFEKSKFRSGAVLRNSSNPFEFIGDIPVQFSNIYGDSVFIAFKGNYNDDPPPFKITFLNMFDDILLIDTLNDNCKVFNVKNLLKDEKAILYKVNSANHESDLKLIKLLNPGFISKVSFDFARLVRDPATTLALYEINSLYFDLIFHLYKTEKLEVINLDQISTAYLARIKDKYQLSQYYNQEK